MLSPLLICLTLISGIVAQDSQPPKRTEAVAPPAGTVMVTGRVVYEDTGQPATRYRVQLIISTALLNARNGLRIPTAITNERGEFTLRGVTAGEYYVFSEPVDQRGSHQLNSVLARSGDSDADAARLDQFKKIIPKSLLTVSATWRSTFAYRIHISVRFRELSSMPRTSPRLERRCTL